MHSVLSCSYQIWNLPSKEVRPLEVFGQQCLDSIARIEWSDSVSNVQVMDLVLGIDSGNILLQNIKPNR